MCCLVSSYARHFVCAHFAPHTVALSAHNTQMLALTKGRQRAQAPSGLTVDFTRDSLSLHSFCSLSLSLISQSPFTIHSHGYNPDRKAALL